MAIFFLFLLLLFFLFVCFTAVCSENEDFPGGSMVKNSPASRRHRFDSWVRKIPGEGNGNTFQYSCLGNSTDRRAWRATVHGVAKESDMT